MNNDLSVLPDGFPLSEAGNHLPRRGGKKTCAATIMRWVTQGRKLRNGTVVRLRAAKVGGIWCTNLTALQEFTSELTRDALGEDAPAVQQIRTAHARAKASAAAAAQLEAAGA